MNRQLKAKFPFNAASGMAGKEDNDEIKELEAKLEALDLPEEAKKITKTEIKKLK